MFLLTDPNWIKTNINDLLIRPIHLIKTLYFLDEH